MAEVKELLGKLYKLIPGNWRRGASDEEVKRWMTEAQIVLEQAAVASHAPSTAKYRDTTYEQWRSGYGEHYVRPKDAWDKAWELATIASPSVTPDWSALERAIRSAKFTRDEFPVPTGFPEEIYPQLMDLIRSHFESHAPATATDILEAAAKRLEHVDDSSGHYKDAARLIRGMKADSPAPSAPATEVVGYHFDGKNVRECTANATQSGASATQGDILTNESPLLTLQREVETLKAANQFYVEQAGKFSEAYIEEHEKVETLKAERDELLEDLAWAKYGKRTAERTVSELRARMAVALKTDEVK